MNLILKLLVLLLSISIYTIVCYDCFFSLYERYSHFHIGRWTDEVKWKNNVRRVCQKWLARTPTLRIKKDCRYLLLDRIRGSYGKKMVQSWQKAGCLLGLEETNLGNQYLTLAKKQLLTPDGKWKQSVDKIDYAMLAYAFLKNEANPNSIKPAMDDVARCIQNNVCPDGMVSYTQGRQSFRRYVDTLGFVCPFLGQYGRAYSDPSRIDFAFDQIARFREIGGLSHGLPYHCVRSDNGLPLGVLGWGRGVGWYSLALVDLFPSISSPEQKRLLKAWIAELAETLVRYERRDGGFSSILQGDCPYDSSATAILGYFYAKSFQILNDVRLQEIAVRCCKKLMKKTKINGVVDECQGDTIDVGIISEKFGEMPFAQGFTLRLAEVIGFRNYVRQP